MSRPTRHPHSPNAGQLAVTRRAPGESRTRNSRILSPSPLPLGYWGSTEKSTSSCSSQAARRWIYGCSGLQRCETGTRWISTSDCSVWNEGCIGSIASSIHSCKNEWFPTSTRCVCSSRCMTATTGTHLIRPMTWFRPGGESTNWLSLATAETRSIGFASRVEGIFPPLVSRAICTMSVSPDTTPACCTPLFRRFNAAARPRTLLQIRRWRPRPFASAARIASFTT